MHRLKLVGGTAYEMGSCGTDTVAVPFAAPGELYDPVPIGEIIFAVVMRLEEKFTIIERQQAEEPEGE